MLPQKSSLAFVIQHALANYDVDINKIANSIIKIYDYYGIITLYQKIPSLLMKTIGLDHKDILIKGLIEFVCLSAALAVIEGYPDYKHLIPLLAIRASQVGDFQLSCRCYNILKEQSGT